LIMVPDQDNLLNPEGKSKESSDEETISLVSSEGRTIEVRNGDVVGRTAVGREVLEIHEEISRRHAQFVMSEGAWFIVDLGSSNGTFLGGERIPPKERIRIRNGQRIMFSPVFQAEVRVREALEEEAGPASVHEEAGTADNPRKTMVILFADLKGSVDFFQERGTIIARNWILQLYRMLSAIISAHRGRHIKNIGDAILAVFENPHEAALAAVRMQDDLRRHNSLADETGRYYLRIGMNMGRVLFEDNDVFGNSVNIASRVQALAPPERIYITQHLYEAIRDDKGVQCRFIGLEQLKGVKEKTGIYEILCDENPDVAKGQGQTC
jgi:class 3 adenylate cyclase